MTTEIELKLAMDSGAAAQTVADLLRHPAVVALKAGRSRTARVISTYFDTADARLADAGIVLRLRRDGTRWLQTVKGPPLAETGGAVHARPEYEWPIAGPRLDPTRLATTPWRGLLGKAIASASLAPQFTTDFERNTVSLEFDDGTRAKLCVDVGKIRPAGKRRGGGQQRRKSVPISEIEIELQTGNVARLFELALALTAELPLTVATVSKSERGFALVRDQPDGWRAPMRAQDVLLTADATAPEALRAIALECLRQIAANAPGLLADGDPEWVHQMRVGTRRLRSCLALAAPFVPRDQLEPLLTEIKWLAGALGPARDWDVFATETVPAFAERFAQKATTATGLRRLRARVGARRNAARAATRHVVRSPRFQRLLLAVGALCATPHFGSRADPGPGVDAGRAASAKAFAGKVLRRRHRKLARRVDASVHGTPQDRHALRIAAKKVRYVAEFFAPLFHRNRAQRYVTALASLQEVLGRGNDAATAARLVFEIAANDDDAVADALRGWIAAEAATVESELARARKRFARTRRFWTRGQDSRAPA